MDVQNLIWKCGHEFWRQEAHVSGEDYEIDFVLAQTGGHVRIMFSALAAFGYEESGGQLQSTRACQPVGVGIVGDHDCDLGCVSQNPGVDCVGNRQEVRSAAGEQNAEAFHTNWTLRSPLTTRPMTWNFSSARFSSAWALRNLSAGTTTIKPTPMLKVRSISS